MRKITVKKKYHAILFLAVFCLLAGCQQSDADLDTGSEQITPTDQAHVEPLTLLEKVEYSLVSDEERAIVELYTSASIADDGQMGWDSGDQWVLLVRQGEQEFLLYDEYVQYGEVQFWVSFLNTNGVESPETEDLDQHIYVMVTSGAGFTMYDYIWDAENCCFQKTISFNPDNQWNVLHSNKYDVYDVGREVYNEKIPVLSASTAISQLSDTLLKQGVELGTGEEKLEWDLESLRIIEIKNSEAYALELRYGQNINSVMAYRRYGTYAILQDGSEAYFLNIATDQWEPLN